MKTKYNYIDQLLTRYYEGETSTAEEEELVHLLFLEESIRQNPDYEEHRAVLAYTTLGRKYANDSKRGKEIPFTPKEKSLLGESEAKQQKKSPRPFSVNHWSAKVASVALLIGIGCTLYFLSQKHNSLNDETCVAYIYGRKSTDKEVVMQQMEQTLSKFSSESEIGVEQPLSKMFQGIADDEPTNPQ